MLARGIFVKYLIPYLIATFLNLVVAQTAWSQQAGYLRIIHLNVGQGDATLIIGTNGKSLLFDTGLKGEARRNIIPVLKTLGIQKLNYLMVSHYDTDHIAGVQAITPFLDRSTISLDRGISIETNQFSNATYKKYREIIKTTKYQPVSVGDAQTIDLGVGVAVHIVAANGMVEGGEKVPLSKSHENAASVALYIRYGEFDYFVAGDLTSNGKGDPNVEAILAPLIPDIDVYRVSHHGSLTSNSALLLNALRPEVAIVSVGFNKGYMLPKREVLERIAGNTATRPTQALFMTNLGYPGDNLSSILLRRMHVASGHVSIFTNGDHYFVNGQIYATDGR